MAQYYQPYQTQIGTVPQIDVSGLNQSLKGLTGSLTDIQNKKLEEARIAKEEAQLARVNKRADAGLLLQQNAEQRAIDAIDKSNREDQALLQYTNQLGVNAQDVVTDADAQKMLQVYDANPNASLQPMYDKSIAGYNASPEQQIQHLQSMTLPSGEYDTTKLLIQKEKALKRPQDTLDAVTAAKVKEADRAQNLKDQMYLINYKQKIKGSGESREKDSYTDYVSPDGNIVRVPKNATEVPKGVVPISIWNDMHGNNVAGKGSSGILDRNGQVDSSKTIMGDPKAITALRDKVSTFYKSSTVNQDNLDKTVKQLYKLQLLTGKSTDEVLIDFDSLSDKGGIFGAGTETIDKNKVDEVYKDSQINLVNPATGVAEIIPMSQAMKLTDTRDSKGNPYYNITNSGGKVSLTINPSYSQNKDVIEAPKAVPNMTEVGPILKSKDKDYIPKLQRQYATAITDEQRNAILKDEIAIGRANALESAVNLGPMTAENKKRWETLGNAVAEGYITLGDAVANVSYDAKSLVVSTLKILDTQKHKSRILQSSSYDSDPVAPLLQ
jgi:hypothetical protein